MTVEDILKEYGAYYDINNKGALAAQKKALEDAAQRNKNTLNTSAQKSIDSIVSLGKEQEREADISAQEALETNNIRKLINEKKVAEAMANQGLTDSGLNRTQQTALQVSHGNAAAQIELQRQKNVDSVAKWIRDNVASVVTERDAKVADIENTLQGNLAQADADYAAGKTKYVQDALEQQQKYTTDMAKARESVMKTISDEAISQDVKNMYIKNYLEQYPDDVLFTEWAIDNGWRDVNGIWDNKNTSSDIVENGVYIDKDTAKEYRGIARNASDTGNMPNSVQVGVLKDAFNKGGLKAYMQKRAEYIGKDVNGVEMDKAMEDIYGPLWQVITSQSTNYESAGNTINVVGKANAFGDTRVASLDVNGQKKTIGDLYKLGEELGMAEDILEDYLTIYANARGEGFRNSEYGGYKAFKALQRKSAQTEEASGRGNFWDALEGEWFKGITGI